MGAMQHPVQDTSGLLEAAAAPITPLSLRTARGHSRPEVPLRLTGQLTRCNSRETSKSAETPTGSPDSSLHGSRPSDSQCISAVWPQGWDKAARGGFRGEGLHTHRAARHEGTGQKSPPGWSSVRHIQLCYLQWVGPPSGLAPPLASLSEPMASRTRLPRLQWRLSWRDGSHRQVWRCAEGTWSTRPRAEGLIVGTQSRDLQPVTHNGPVCGVWGQLSPPAGSSATFFWAPSPTRLQQELLW